MKLRMPIPTLPDDGFTGADIFGRKQVADSLLNISEKIEDNLVFLLDSPWGSGKTFFLRQLKNYAASKGFPCIYFDAFQNDIRQDAFAAITSELLVALEESEPAAKKFSKSLSKKAVVVGKHLLKGTAVAAAHYATAGIINAELISKLSSDPDISNAIKKGTDQAIESSLISLSENVIQDHKNTQASIEELRLALDQASENLVRSLATEDSSNPHQRTFLIVDELDRCRPNFALDVLEVVKHIFNVEKITFIVSADSVQLCESVRHCYGAGINSERYLEKFFDVRLRFPDTDENDRPVLQRYASHIASKLPTADPDSTYIDTTLKNLVHLSQANNLSIRSFQKVCQNFILVLSQTRKNHYRIPPIIALLCFCREIFPNIYSDLITNKTNYPTLLKKLALVEEKDDYGQITWFYACIRWALADDINSEPPEVRRFDESLFSYSLDRNQVIPVLAKKMVEPSTIIIS